LLQTLRGRKARRRIAVSTQAPGPLTPGRPSERSRLTGANRPQPLSSHHTGESTNTTNTTNITYSRAGTRSGGSIGRSRISRSWHP
jgi:hypothetical protein